MSQIFGHCPLDMGDGTKCGRPLIQEYAGAGWRYVACLAGHAWRMGGPHNGIYPRRESDAEAPAPKQIRKPLAEHRIKVPPQDKRFRWCYWPRAQEQVQQSEGDG